MKNLYRHFFFIFIMLFGIEGIQAQVTSGDFIYSASVSDSLRAPTRMAIDQNDNIYVADSYTNDIKKYNPSGNLMEILTFSGSPLSLALNSSNELFIGDGTTGNILKYNSNGTTSVFYSGSLFPTSMAFSPDNQLYVSDSKLSKVLVINTAGTLIQTIGQGTLRFPTGIAYDRKNNRIIVGEHGGAIDNVQTRVYIYGLNGTLISQIGSYGSTDGKFYRVQGITVGRCGNIYVCEPFQGNVSVFRENGTFITKFGQFGTGQGQLNVPMDIVSDSQERILLTSMNNGSLEVFTINDPLPSASIISGNASLCPGGSAEITVKFTGTAPWNFTYTLNGSNPVAVSNVTANPYHLTVTQAGTYLITALSDAYETGSCFSGSATITLKPSPTATLAGPGTAICLGQTAEVPVELTGTAPWSLIYNVNSTIPVAITNITSSPYWLTIDQPGTYTLTSVLDHNCTGSVTVGNAITVNPLPTSTIQSFSDTVCAGTTVNIPVYFTGTSPWTVDYTLDGINTITLVTNSNPYILTVSDPGSYRVISLSDANCTGTNLTGEVNLAINPKPVPAFNFLTNNMMVSFTNHSHHATSYFWNFGDSKTSTSANPMHKYKLPGTYNVVLVASNQACGIVKTKKLVIVSMNDDQQVADSKITGGKVNDTEMNISLYPNPSGGLFTIAFKNAGPSDLTVEILSSTGQLVYRSIVKVPELPEDRELVTDQVDLGHFSGGIYTVKVFSNELMKTEKLILNK